ncbi:MAG TPA: DUF177 domain-containing protein [Thermoanaerobaculia bacterium]
MKPVATFSLDTITDEPLRFEFELPMTVEALDREPLVSISPAQIAGEVTRVEGGYALSARLTWHGELECSRCLAPYGFVNDEEFSLLLYPRRPIAQTEIEMDREDFDAYFYDDPVVPVAPIAEERIQMAVPMKPLCRVECRGLCPRCGSDLNLSECDCDFDEVDPRWRALQLLKKE